MNHFLSFLFTCGLGIFIVVLSMLYLRQGCAYLPTSRFGWDEEWSVDRDSNPILFWTVIAIMFGAGVWACVYSFWVLAVDWNS